MSTNDWKRYFWRNTFTNYARTLLRMGSGLVLFRLTFQQMSPEAFGFYSLLWSLFGYSILLDFGLGFTAQKAVAERTADGRIEALNQLICTVFWTFAFLGAVMLAGFAVMQPFFLEWTKVPLVHRAEFGAAYTIFICAIGVAFPLGIFPEMLRGLQRIDLANWVTIVSLVINLALMSWGLLAGWAFHWIVLISVATTVTPNIVAVFLVFARIPGLSLHPRHFRFAAVQQTLSFSLVAYLITFTNLIIGRTDQMVISFCLGVAMVGLYQAGYKAADMFGLFSGQMQDSLTPAAARLNAGKDQAGLCDLLVRSTRLMLFMVVPLYGLCAVYLEPLIKILTGIKVLDQQTFWVGQALLLSTFSSLLTDSCSKRVLMMCGWERRLLRASLASAGLNLVASLALVWRLGVLGVALGTMIPTILVGWFWIVPMTAEFLKLSVPALLTEFARGVAWPIVASVLTLLVLVLVFPLEPGAHFVACVWRGAVVMGVLAAVGWGFIRSVRKSG